jgi:hypothetical protein
MVDDIILKITENKEASKFTKLILDYGINLSKSCL